jgi:hypothetical protein
MLGKLNWDAIPLNEPLPLLSAAMVVIVGPSPHLPRKKYLSSGVTIFELFSRRLRDLTGDNKLRKLP